MASGHAIATLVLFFLSVFFVIRPISIPAPRPLPRIPLNLVTAPIIFILILWAAQCLNSTVIRNGIVGTGSIKPYNIIILFFSLSYMAIALDISGVLRAATYWASKKGNNNGWRIYFIFYILFTLVSIFLGNDPVILSGTAYLVYYAQVAEIDPTAWVMAEFAAANTASMLLFVGNPANLVICEGFDINSTVFTAYTVLPFVACNVFCLLALALQFRKQVPRKLTRAAYQDPLRALRDPISACVGGFILGLTLVLLFVFSFFGIDAWMISLPAAFAQFIFGIGWDYYRISHKIPVGLPEELSDKGSAGENQDYVDDSPSRCASISVERSGSVSSFWSQSHSPIVTREDDAEQPATSLPPPRIIERGNDDESQPEPPTIEPKLKPIKQLPTLPFVKRMEIPFTLKYLPTRLFTQFSTIVTAFPRLPFTLVPFMFSLFILVEALDHQEWVNVFADWFVRASRKQLYPTIWLVGILDIVLCNLLGTNLGATILPTKVFLAATPPPDVKRAAAIALAVGSNIGAVNATFSSSLAGLLWRSILDQKGVHVRQRSFASWNMLPLVTMTAVGLGVVSAEIAVLLHRS